MCSCASGSARGARRRVRCAIDLMTKGVLVFRSAQPEFVPVAADASYEALVRIPANLAVRNDLYVNVSITLIRGEDEEHALVVNKALAFMVYGEQGVTADDGRHRKGVVNLTLRVDAADGDRHRPCPAPTPPPGSSSHASMAPSRGCASCGRYLRPVVVLLRRTPSRPMYRRSALGWLWLLLRVVAPIGLNALVFGDMLNQAEKVEHAPHFLFSSAGWPRG